MSRGSISMGLISMSLMVAVALALGACGKSSSQAEPEAGRAAQTAAAEGQLAQPASSREAAANRQARSNARAAGTSPSAGRAALGAEPQDLAAAQTLDGPLDLQARHDLTIAQAESRYKAALGQCDAVPESQRDECRQAADAALVSTRASAARKLREGDAEGN